MSWYKPSVALVYSSVANDVNKAKGVVIVGDESSTAVMSKRISQVDCESEAVNGKCQADCLPKVQMLMLNQSFPSILIRLDKSVLRKWQPNVRCSYKNL